MGVRQGRLVDGSGPKTADLSKRPPTLLCHLSRPPWLFDVIIGPTEVVEGDPVGGVGTALGREKGSRGCGAGFTRRDRVEGRVFTGHPPQRPGRN